MAEKEKRKYNYTMKPGRPTKYDPVYCDQIIAFFMAIPADVAASRIAELLNKADVKQLKGYGVSSDE